MSVTSTVSEDGSQVIIKVDGNFDYSANKEFRSAYRNYNTQPVDYLIDMKETSYVDSSALGMLLLLRNYADGEGANIGIINCNNDVMEILNIANFDNLFDIH